MATEAPNTAVAPTDSTDLMNLGSITGVAERPKSLDPNDRTGADVSMDEIRLPRLSIAQGLSPEITEGNSSFIEGLKNFDMFNNMTRDIYGRGPITFVPLQKEWRCIQFRPRTEGGGIIEPNVPKGDARREWRRDPGGDKTKDLPPLATEFFEMASLVLRPGKAPEPVIISMKTTNKWNRKAADQMLLLIGMRQGPIYSGLYTISSAPEKNDKGTFGVPVIKNAGYIPKDTPAGAALFEYAERMAKSFVGKKIETEREPGDDFDPNELERTPPAAESTGSEM